jgi:hypothetical protein
MAGLSGIMELEDVEVIELSVLRKGLIITLNVKTLIGWIIFSSPSLFKKTSRNLLDQIQLLWLIVQIC